MNVQEARAVGGELREELEGEEIGVEGLMTRDLREARLWRVRGIPVKACYGVERLSAGARQSRSIGVGR